MKALPVVVALALAAVPWYASAADHAAAKTATRPKSLSAAPAPVQDSPLVRAAKATGRLGKTPKFVITNDTLRKFRGGHITTTNASVALPPIPPGDIKITNAPAAGKKADTGVTKSEKLKKERALRHAAADLNGESIEQQNDDGAAQEHAMEQATSTQPVKPPV